MGWRGKNIQCWDIRLPNRTRSQAGGVLRTQNAAQCFELLFETLCPWLFLCQAYSLCCSIWLFGFLAFFSGLWVARQLQFGTEVLTVVSSFHAGKGSLMEPVITGVCAERKTTAAVSLHSSPPPGERKLEFWTREAEPCLGGLPFPHYFSQSLLLLL